MLKYCVEKWYKNKELLMNALKSEEVYNKLSDCTYSYLVKLVVKYILNDGKSGEYYNTDEWDEDNITEVDNGGYQGTLLYLIPAKICQPCENEYLITFVEYGSCSECDTLLNIQMLMPANRDYYDSDDQFESIKRRTIEDFMTLCLHLVQHMKKPYINTLDKHDYSEVEGIYNYEE